MTKKKVVATIEARMGSTRLPGKVLMDIGGLLSLECQIKRVRQSKFIDEIVIATTTNPSDDQIEEFGNSIQCKIFRGSEEDVMERILLAVELVQGEIQVQLTGDCPLLDSEIIDELVEFILNNSDYDFISNEIVRSYPIGLDCRVFKVSALRRANLLCKDPLHRVHGSTFMYTGDNKHLFKSKNFLAPHSLNHPMWRWTLDTNEDLIFLRTVLENFGENIVNLKAKQLSGWLLKNPKVIEINNHVRQKKIEEG